jgi:hypothetical protein
MQPKLTANVSDFKAGRSAVKLHLLARFNKQISNSSERLSDYSFRFYVKTGVMHLSAKLKGNE